MSDVIYHDRTPRDHHAFEGACEGNPGRGGSGVILVNTSPAAIMACRAFCVSVPATPPPDASRLSPHLLVSRTSARPSPH